MTNQVEDLIDRAHAGERLTSTDRQRCVAHLLSAGQPKTSNVAMAKQFQVSEAQIRSDRKRLAPKPRPDVTVTFTPSATEPPPAPEGYELVVTTYLLTVPYDEQERRRLMRDDGRKKQKVRQSSILRMSLAAIAADIVKGKL